jgi:copper chaperone NosL
MNKRVLLLLILTTLVTVACNSAPNFDEPPEIRYGEDICERCTMIISEPRYAAAYVTTEGEARLFDDIGGMLAHNRAVSEDVAVFWVHDFDTEEWLKADDAYFVESEHITPMGYGIVAFRDSGRAEAWALEKEGQVLSFAELL